MPYTPGHALIRGHHQADSFMPSEVPFSIALPSDLPRRFFVGVAPGPLIVTPACPATGFIVPD